MTRTSTSIRHASTTSLLAVSMAGLLVMTASSAQAAATTVPLGTAGTYAILAGSGITNTGITTISGDVGSSPTASETGFTACPGANCVTLTGANHTSPNPNDAVTQGAKAALTTAYNNAAGQTPGVVLTELAGQTLVAGVYTSASGTFGMSGTLTLDGANNANSVFIFQTASTLITGGTGSINLIRGAQACNIFWKVGSAATLGAGSTLDGTVMAHDSISLGSGVTVIGRLLAGEQASGAGAVTLIHDTIIRPTCAATPVVPPSASASATPKPSTAAASASAAAASKLAAAAKAAAASKSAAALKAAAAAVPGAGAGGVAAPGAPQIERVPVGAVHTGDGSSIRHAGSVPSVVAVGIATLGLAIAAASVTASTRAHRRRRQR
ncbi:MAG TPA: ice-binding family protein [Acidothermaceae bacterium]|nr:ice-binding family protein [Acidothermaceae bacterium]